MARAAGDDPRDVEQVFDQLRLDPRRLSDALQTFVEKGLPRFSVAQQTAPADDRGQRCSQFVRHRCQELVFLVIRFLGALPSRVLLASGALQVRADLASPQM